MYLDTKTTYCPTHSRKLPEKRDFVVHTHRRGKAIFAKDCPLDGLFAFTLAAPLPKKFYNFLGSHFFTLYSHNKKRFAC